jgi:type I restriction enzyme M protein
MAIKKSELYSSLWASCDQLRGGMDASQYKDYVLTLLFVKYVSDKYADKEEAVVSVPAGGSFKDMVALKGKTDIGDQINQIISRLAEENDLRGVIDLTDFNDEEKLGKGKDMVDRLSNLIGIFENPSLNFSKNQADGDDILGDAYEYLMRHFATESGKSKGQFYTPAEVSRVLAKVIGVEKATNQSQTVYDPTCGSGSLLLKVADEAPHGLTIYGQEMDNATKALAVMNMWLHNYPTAEIWKGNTLAEPHWAEENRLKQHDFVVANPPFSTKSWSNGIEPASDLYQRFIGFGIPPEKNGDYAFLLHILKSLKSTGKGAVILPHGVLFRGGSEGAIRKNLIQRGYIKGIIGLAPNLFYGTGIPACIIVVDKEYAATRKGIFMIDASKSYTKDGNKNRLREQDIHEMVDVFNSQIEVPGYARMVSIAEIEKNEFNLNIPRYIDAQEKEDIQDLQAHLSGGIPARDIDALSAYWEVYPNLKASLFELDRPGYYRLKVSKEEVKPAIYNHPEFKAYSDSVGHFYLNWKEENMPKLLEINEQTNAKVLIFELAESILKHYHQKPLVDKYKIYQHLMNFWNEVMKDDLYMLIEDGWKAKLEPITDAKGKVKKGEFECSLIPKSLLVNRFFKSEHQVVIALEQQMESIAANIQEIVEEHNSEEGLLLDATNDSNKITKASLQQRKKELLKKPTLFLAAEPGETYGFHANVISEEALIEQLLNLYEEEAKVATKYKEAYAKLHQQVLDKYPELTLEEIQQLVIEDKWLNTIRQTILAEVDSISQALAQRIKELGERYDAPLPALDQEVNALTNKVNAHLANMGLVWN